MLIFSRVFKKRFCCFLLLLTGFLFVWPRIIWANDGRATYKVKNGDTISAIAKAHYTDSALVAAMNNLQENETLKVGQLIFLPKDPEIEVTVEKGDNIWTLARKYQTTTTNIINYNNLTDPENLKLGQKILVPEINLAEEPQAIAVNAIASRGERLQRLALLESSKKDQGINKSKQEKNTLSSTNWLAPVHGIISSAFGKRSSGFHHGLDIAAEQGTKIKAIAGGVVTFAGWKNNIYGYAVEVDHGNGWKSLYAHCSKVLVKTGYNIKAGKNIALVGSTGNSTGPHVHLEMRKDGTILNPAKYVKVD